MTVIGIPQMGTDLFRSYMKSKYTQSIQAAGGSVCWIELDDPQEAILEALSCDGLILPGGPDIDPALYQQNPLPSCGKPNPLRDSTESALIEPFLATGKPLLAICRGMQLLNIHFKGTLFQDIRDMQTYKHSDFFGKSGSTHPVDISQDTLLYSILDTCEANVDSIHHQAVNKLGNGLIISARSPDGVVEGIELPEHPFCIGVQWHPEHMSRRSPMQRQLFKAFVTACENNKPNDQDIV